MINPEKAQMLGIPPQQQQNVQPLMPRVDPRVLQGFGMAPPPQDSIGVIKMLLPILSPEQLHYVTALMQRPEEFSMANPQLGLQPQASMQPDPLGNGPANGGITPSRLAVYGSDGRGGLAKGAPPVSPEPQGTPEEQVPWLGTEAEDRLRSRGQGIEDPLAQQPWLGNETEEQIKLRTPVEGADSFAQDQLSQMSKAALAPRLNASGGSTSGEPSNGPQFSY